MVKLKPGNNVSIPLGRGISVLSLSPVIVFQEKYNGDIVLRKYGDSTEEKKIIPSETMIKIRGEKEIDLLDHKEWFIVVSNGLTHLDMEVSQPAELFYDNNATKEYPSGYSKPGEPLKEICPVCGLIVLKSELMKHIMSH